MRHWLSHFITALAVLCLAGAALVGALALGFYSWGAVLLAGAIGAALGLPVGWTVTRAIRRNDPNWPARRPA